MMSTFRDTFQKMMTGKNSPKTRRMDFRFGPLDVTEITPDSLRRDGVQTFLTTNQKTGDSQASE
jgi:hypothetical protein